jgi:hypothetical protein
MPVWCSLRSGVWPNDASPGVPECGSRLLRLVVTDISWRRENGSSYAQSPRRAHANASAAPDASAATRCRRPSESEEATAEVSAWEGLET